jgi:two-component system sensor histidine kinase VicK
MDDVNAQNEAIFTAVIERTNNICFAFNVQEKKFIYVNPSLEFFLSLTNENVKENSSLLLRMIYEDDLVYAFENYQKIFEQRFIKDVVLRIKLPDTELRSLKLEAWLLEINGMLYIAGIADDISDEQQQLFVLNKFSEKKNSILEILSHDLTAPLGNIQMCTALIKSQGADLKNELVTNMLDRIMINSERSLKLIREFLKKEFLETYEASLVKMRINIVEKIKNFIAEFKKAESELNKTILFSTESEPIYVHVDEPKFIQVLQNLFSNAMKFTPDGGTIKIEVTDKDTDVLISVEDDGIGIPENLQKDIFEKFSKAGRPGLKGEKSVGLGMSIIKRIVEWHNGRIWFISEENKGTTFYIQIPK